jgi:hypothetical protein
MFSFGFYDKTGQLVGNFWLFKATMIFVASFTIYITLRKHFTSHTDWLQTAGTVMAVNVILDVLILVLLFKMPVLNWLIQVLPVYLVVMPLTCYILSRFIPKSK